MIVTIDGPAGAGKSSVARALSNRLGFQFLDTGAMYRAVVWAGIQDGIELDDEQALATIARDITINFSADHVMVNEIDVTREIRTHQVTEAVRHSAGNPEVRRLLVEQQRRIAASARNLVTEGRDQGSVVFPNAECKIFLTATPEERAKRRYRELIRKGEEITYAEVLEAQNQRDASDQARAIGPLVKPTDAIEVYTDEMTQDEVITQLAWVVESSRNSREQ